MCLRVFFPQINANTPDSVFQFIEYVKELLLYIHQQFIIPSLQYLSAALQRAWKSLQDSCKSVLHTFAPMISQHEHDLHVTSSFVCLCNQFSCLCSGEVTLHCLQDHLKTLTNVTWIYLQDATSAVKSRAQELLSRA